jgi:GNAT superfamily N-acetyltransferase
MSDIRLAVTAAEIRATHPVMVQLRTHLDAEAYVAQVLRQQAEDNYRLVALHDGEAVRAVAGFRIATALALGHYLYVDDLVTDAEHRSRGFGRELLDWMDAYGRAQGCTSLHLDSGTQRHAAHRFYLRERMDIVFFHFRRAMG